MLILEGPDNIGKTTLAHRLVKMANERIQGRLSIEGQPVTVDYRHMTRPPEEFNYFLDYKPMTEDSMFTVQDRFHLGTIAYDEKPFYNRDQLRIIESWIYRQGSMIVLILPTDLRNYEIRLHTDSKDEMFDVPRMIRAATIYQEIAQSDFNKNHEFGIHPVVDYAVMHPIKMDGKFKERTNEEAYEADLNGLVDQWFSRISWAIKASGK